MKGKIIKAILLRKNNIKNLLLSLNYEKDCLRKLINAYEKIDREEDIRDGRYKKIAPKVSGRKAKKNFLSKMSKADKMKLLKELQNK